MLFQENKKRVSKNLIITVVFFCVAIFAIAVISKSILPPSGKQTAQVASGNINAVATANYASCVAPCAVFFDATESTHSTLDSVKEFLFMDYMWEFNDPYCTNQVWNASGKSKCSDRGPVAGHVYETPGTYEATLYVSYDGETDTAVTSQITVTNPDTVYNGANTICLRADNSPDTWDGCPNGANQITNSDLDTAMGTTPTGNQRWLLRRGDVFHIDQTLNLANGGIYIFAWGSGSDPLIELDGNSSIFQVGANSRFVDFDIVQGTYDPSTSGYTAAFANLYSGGQSQFHDSLILRVDVTRLEQFIGMGGTNYTNYGYNDNIAVVDSKLFERYAGGSTGIYVFATKFLFMGNEFDDVVPGWGTGGEHTLRIPFTNKAVLSHNSLKGPNEHDRHIIKLHGNSGSGSPTCSEEIVINDNRLIGRAGSTQVELGFYGGSVTSSCAELMRVERNHCTLEGTPGYGQRCIGMWGSDSLVANNLIVQTGVGRYTDGIQVSKKSGAGDQNPDRNYVLHNTCYTTNSDTGFHACVTVTSEASNTTVHNNIMWAPTLASQDVAVLDNQGIGTIFSNNEVTNICPFVSSNPTSPNDFKLSPSSTYIDAGFSMPAVAIDFVGNSRPSGAGYDIGAFEYQSTQTGPYCGDNSCNGTETCSTCSGDCGVCATVTCASFTYSTYGTCQSNNTQSRTVTSSSPSGCTGGSPVTTQSCTYTPSAICGNNTIETGEQCDDGNTTNGDGCSSSCQTEQPTQSTKFQINNRVEVSSGPLNIRQTANGALLGQQSTGAQGTVIGGPTFANSLWWWNINFDSGVDGWATEEYLTLGTNGNTNTGGGSTGGGTTGGGSTGGGSTGGGSTGGGSTGSGGGGTTPPTTGSNTNTTPPQNTETCVTTNTQTTTNGPTITRWLTTGTTGTDVKNLQIFLNANGYAITQSGIGSKGNETNYFGTLTREALQKFQCARGIVCAGSPTSTGYGATGPKTRTAITATGGTTQTTCTATSTTPTTPSSGTVTITRWLTTGTTGTDVKNLQIFLNANGYTITQSGPGSKGNETNYFGALTREPLQKL